eukprot:s132_g34.t1
MKSPFQTVITGAPMTPRSAASEAGAWAGVGFVTTCPSRTIAVPWPLDVYESGRIQFVSAFLSPAWVTGAVVYGYPTGKNHLDAQERTVKLLDFACDHLLSLPGPRFFGGDWNYEPHELAITVRLQAAGWQEIQDLEFCRTGKLPVATCKSTTRKDVLWVSPELAFSFRGASVDHTTFADHSILVGSFARDPAPYVRYLWPCPAQVRWTSAPDLERPVDFQAPSDPTAQYAALWHQREQQARSVLGPDWSPAMSGRAQQTQPFKKLGWPKPLKVSRSHEIQPQFFGFSALHAKRFKQLRRLQNYCRWVENVGTAGCSADGVHGIELWKSILRGSGFSPSFSAWWLQREVIRPADPAVIPYLRPSPAVARQIFDTMVAEVRLLEQRLLATKRAYRQFQHTVDRNLIFREVAREPPAPVETLLHRSEAVVESLDLGESAVVLDRPVDLLPDEPVWIAGAPVAVVHADHDKVWLESVDGLAVKDQLVQTRQLGDLDAIFQAFHDQWKVRWCKHDDIPNSQWHDIVMFAQRVMRPRSVPPMHLDGSVVLAEAKRKKKWAATGLDGVSRSDVLALGPHALTSVINLYERAETDGEWPRQLVAGKVHSLAKVVGASLPNQFRPITVFSMIYRVWSSLQSRYLIRQAAEWIHEGAYGNRQHVQAAHLWTQVADAIQTSYATGVPLAGLAADIEKCFNTIPRWPILVASILAGTPFGVNVAWAGALSQMIRHFKVRDSYSPGFPTSTGLAEGCGLSVYGMCLLDHLFHTWISCQTPAIRTLSFVDDWQLITSDMNWACRQLDLVLEFAEMLDLSVDRRKTVAWSTDAPTRSHLRATGIRVVHHARELGSHMAISRQFTNKTVKDRLADLELFWAKLRASRCGHATKVRALKTVAWPRGLHAVSAVPLGDSVWVALRRRVKFALDFQKAGVNSLLLLGLSEHGIDPQLVTLVHTIKDARAFQPLDFWATTVYPCAVSALALPPNAPAQIALQRVQEMGFTVLPDGRLKDRFGCFCPQTTHFAEVELRLHLAWHQFVAARVSHRPEFRGLDRVDACATRCALQSLSLSDRALLRLSLCGGFFTEDVKSKWSGHSDACSHCGQPDSVYHRYWACPAYAVARQTLAPDVLPLLDQLPEALTLRGWTLCPSTRDLWLSYLDSVPVEVPQIAMPLDLTRWNHVFTDGSCLVPTCPSLRLASWSAVLASPLQALRHGCVRGILGSGPLPGLCQTAHRAELYALAVVLHWASRVRARVCLWLDCKGVLSRFLLVIRHGWFVHHNHPHADLWKWIQSSVADLGLDRVRVRKVRAHGRLTEATDSLEWWKMYHNDVADRTAKLANQARPAQVWALWQQHVRETFAADRLAAQVRALHLAVARAQVMSKQSDVREEDAALSVRPTREFEMSFDNQFWTGQPLVNLATKYGHGHATRVTAWWTARTAAASGEIKWVSFVQLFVDFCLTFGLPGPLKVNHQWIDKANRPYFDDAAIAFRIKVRWFKRFVQNMLSEGRVTTTFQQCRPASVAIQAYIPCLAVAWSNWHLERVDAWLLANLKEKCTRSAAALTRLPPISRDETMEIDLP